MIVGIGLEKTRKYAERWSMASSSPQTVGATTKIPKGYTATCSIVAGSTFIAPFRRTLDHYTEAQISTFRALIRSVMNVQITKKWTSVFMVYLIHYILTSMFRPP